MVMEGGTADRLKNFFFLTTLGSWGEKVVFCQQAYEGSTVKVNCPIGVVTSIRAFYGDA